MKKNLIIGLAANYNWAVLRNFVCSLRQTDYKDEVILFVSPDIDQPTRDSLARHSVKFIEVDSSSPYLNGLPPDVYKDPTFLSKLPPSVYRILVFYNFLMEKGSDYNYILLTDVRDVVFQKDPFAFAICNKMCFFMESRSLLLKDSDWNALWIVATFGVKVLYDKGDNLISCIGTVIGPMPRMIAYLALLVKYLKDVQVFMMFGIEQAAHNYVILNKEVDDFLVFYTEDGPIATLSSYKEIQQDENGYYLNSNNDLANVVHQYDRHPSLKAFYDLKFK